jgi:hypothetical protein
MQCLEVSGAVRIIYRSLGVIGLSFLYFLYNCFLRIHVQPEDGYDWKAETCSCTLGSNVNTPLPSNKQVVLD